MKLSPALVIAGILGVGLLYLVSHSRIVLHGSSLVGAIIGIGVALWIAYSLGAKK